MKVTFLGTGTSQGVPIIACQCKVCQSSDYKDKRLRSSVLIETENTSFVIDTGPDFRQQMLRAKTKKMDAVVFTHGHKDHTAGFDDIRGFNYVQQKAMDVYGDMYVEIVLKRDFYYAFEENKYPGVPDLNLHVINNQKFKVGDVEVLPIELKHYKLPIKGFRVGDFTYITDANFIEEEEKEKIRGSKVLVLNALRKTEHISHFSLEEAIALGKELDIPQVYFTHISHQMGFHKEVDAELPEGMNLSYDGLTIEL
ncbi:MAG: MBL fold metallo-hydrolase [Bacteroidia bacterium]|nr:MBL fold metallo-hydrolase [Bacteroidia bacterium]